jgi:hypothetical protein
MKQIKTFDTFINEAMAPTDPMAIGTLKKIYAALKPFGFELDEMGKQKGRPAIMKGNSDWDGIDIHFLPKEEIFKVFITVKNSEKLGPKGKDYQVRDTTAADKILKLVEPFKKLPFNMPAPQEKGYEG